MPCACVCTRVSDYLKGICAGCWWRLTRDAVLPADPLGSDSGREAVTYNGRVGQASVTRPA